IIDFGTSGNPLGSHLYKLSAVDATVVPFAASGVAELTFRSIAGGETGLAGRPDGFAVKAGRIYLSSSSYDFSPADITDWRGFLTRISSEENALWDRLPESPRRRIPLWLKSNESVEKGLAKKGNSPDVRLAISRTLDELLVDPGLTGNFTGAADGAVA